MERSEKQVLELLWEMVSSPGWSILEEDYRYLVDTNIEALQKPIPNDQKWLIRGKLEEQRIFLAYKEQLRRSLDQEEDSENAFI